MLKLIESPYYSTETTTPIVPIYPNKRPVKRVRGPLREEESGFQMECGIQGEQALWRAVITQALMDAGSESTKREVKFHRAQSRAWFSRRNPDFVTVCTLAGLEVDYVFEKATKAIREGCTWRQKPSEKQKNRR